MRIMTVSAVVALASLGAASAIAADPIRPSADGFAASPATAAVVGTDARVGFKRSRKSSDLTQTGMIAVGVLGVAAVAGGIAAATSGGGGHSDSGVSPQ